MDSSDNRKLKADIAIIGGGAAGLMCACVAAKKHREKKVLVIEKENRVGKKLLVTGNGKCNLTNLNTRPENYHGDFDGHIKLLINKYSPAYVIDYFKSIGLECKADSVGRVYPRCKQASAVLSVLRNEMQRYGAEEMCETCVTDISKAKDSFIIKTNTKEITSDKLIIATGGAVSYTQKENKEAYDVLKKLGYRITKLTPSLSPVRVNSSVIKSLKGIRADALVSLVKDGKIIKSEAGEIQFTDSALSGICIFNLSRMANREKECKIRVALLPEYSILEIKNMLYQRIELVGKSSVQEIFTGLFHKNIALALLKECYINTNIAANTLTKSQINSLANKINEWDFDVIKKQDFTGSQVTAGGVSTKIIDPKTFESKVHKGLYICGEALNVDGDCGGYNLQFAFASSMCIGENI